MAGTTELGLQRPVSQNHFFHHLLLSDSPPNKIIVPGSELQILDTEKRPSPLKGHSLPYDFAGYVLFISRLLARLNPKHPSLGEKLAGNKDNYSHRSPINTSCIISNGKNDVKEKSGTS